MQRLLRALLGVVVLVGVIAVAVGAVVAFGFDRPTVETTESHVVGVNATTTLIETDLTVSNPNPVDIHLDDATVTHTVRMNGIVMGTGTEEGLRITPGTTDVTLTTAIDNRKIPEWWGRHVENGGRTRVETTARLSVPVLGRVATRNRTTTFRTNITDRLNSSASRPVNASLPFVSDPVLVVERTRATWGETTRETTPLEARITLSNPKPVAYTIARLDYTVTMNGVTVGNGTTNRTIQLTAGERRTLRAEVVIRNDRLDDWWVTHVRRGQHTDFRVAFTAVVALPNGDTVRVPLDGLDYTATLDTHILEANRSAGRNERGGLGGPTHESEHGPFPGSKPSA